MLQIIQDSKPANKGKKKRKKSASHYTILKKWLSSHMNTSIPDELLLNSSPINYKVLLTLFLGIGKVNYFMNKTMNNFYLYSVSKKELLLFIKKTMKDCKINANELYFQKWDPVQHDINKLKAKFPYLKIYDCLLFLEQVLKKKDKQLLETLGLKTPSAKKIKLGRARQKPKKKQIKNKEPVSLEQVIATHFVIQRL